MICPPHFKRNLALIASFFLVSSAAVAGIEQAVFSNANGATQSVEGSDLGFISINSAIQLYISSGLDRKLEVQLVSDSGNIVDNVETSVINISDRLTVGGDDFYGKIVTLDAPPSDGSYRFVVKSVDLSGSITSTSSYSFIQDTTAPTIAGSFTLTRNAWYATIDKFGRADTVKQLNVSGVTDANGIDHVKYWVNQSDNTKKYADIQYNNYSNSVVIDGSIAASTNMVPSPGYYEFGIDVVDLAGNKSTKSRYSHIDLTCPSTDNSVTQVYNENSEVWQTYSPGMVIYANPVKVRYGRDLNDFATPSAPYGWKIGSAISYSDGNYAYYERTFPYKQQYSYFHFFSESGHRCRTHRLSSFNFTLASGVDLAPVHTKLAYKTNLSDKWVTSASFRTSKPATITTVRLFGQARSYRQKRTLRSGGTCYIEIGSSYCDISTNYKFSTGRGYIPYAHHAYKADGTMGLHSGYLLTYWDYNAPKIKGLTQNKLSRSIQMNTFDADTTSDWRSGIWVISSAGASAVVDGIEIALSSPTMNKIDYQHREYTFDTSSLDVAAIVPITFFVEDSYGNKTEKTESYAIDTKKPEVSVTYSGTALPDFIADIRGLEFKVEDFSVASLTSVQLTGSDANENVYLAIVDKGDGNFSVEKPRIFPTLDYDSGERYTLNLIAQDEFGNSVTKSIVFGYMPENLIVVDTQQYLPSNGAALYDVSDHAIASIYSEEILTLDSSQIATGKQQAEISNRKNSDFPIVVRGNDGLVTVAPGETKTMLVDLGVSGSKLDIEVYPANNTEGSAEFMFNIPTLTTIY